MKKVLGLDEPVRFAAESVTTTLRNAFLGRHGLHVYTFRLHTQQVGVPPTERYFIHVFREGEPRVSEEFDVTKETFDYLRGLGLEAA